MNKQLTKKQLGDILKSYYGKYMIDSILTGRRIPTYKIIVEIQEKHEIPVEAWVNLQGWIK